MILCFYNFMLEVLEQWSKCQRTWFVVVVVVADKRRAFPKLFLQLYMCVNYC